MTAASKGKSVLTVVLLLIGVAVAGSIGACSYKSRVRNSAFDAVQVGDTEASVIARFGTQPSVREKPGALFARYASQPCGGECAERLWFENRLSLDTEAWSVELDKNSHVIKKSRWVSP
ncbi:hypothetical protein [Pseudoduganella aquatica]|uniref:hypothetical protein n=1 Tax=Pseudoduganella aquatica TaxID=2660641 RepID=UPI001E335569|nr:hypothetical protein [Pseudoduganella aquatica]